MEHMRTLRFPYKGYYIVLTLLKPSHLPEVGLGRLHCAVCWPKQSGVNAHALLTNRT